MMSEPPPSRQEDDTRVKVVRAHRLRIVLKVTDEERIVHAMERTKVAASVLSPSISVA